MSSSSNDRQREMASKGGRASGRARKRKRERYKNGEMDEWESLEYERLLAKNRASGSKGGKQRVANLAKNVREDAQLGKELGE